MIEHVATGWDLTAFGQGDGPWIAEVLVWLRSVKDVPQMARLELPPDELDEFIAELRSLAALLRVDRRHWASVRRRQRARVRRRGRRSHH